MNTFTHIIQSINWVDVAMLVLLIRIVFIGVKTGFVTELFKLFGILCAVFVSFHYYTILADFCVKKTNGSPEIWELVFFVSLVGLTVLLVKFLRDGFFMIFKFETTNEKVNQWGSGVFSVARALLLASLVMFGLLLSNMEYLQRQTLKSISQKLALKAAPQTYKFMYDNFIGKIFAKEKFNDEVFMVISKNSLSRKKF